jgi:hypothetical protein
MLPSAREYEMKTFDLSAECSSAAAIRPSRGNVSEF